MLFENSSPGSRVSGNVLHVGGRGGDRERSHPRESNNSNINCTVSGFLWQGGVKMAAKPRHPRDLKAGMSFLGSSFLALDKEKKKPGQRRVSV